MEPQKRIEYIDAMRGFTMLLVIYAHIELFSLNINYIETFTLNRVLILTRMPLFFFISGFILYKSTFLWNFSNTLNFLKKKFMVQIIPTTFFIFIYVICFNQNIKDLFFNPHKNGYWFTYTLFQYFIFYSIIQNFIQIFKLTIVR